VADVAHPVGIGRQIFLVASLRWRILRNHLRKKGTRLDLIGLFAAAVGSGALVLGSGFAFCAGAYASISTGHTEWMTLLFWGIFLFWQLFPVLVAGLGVSFQFRTLLRFPISLTAFFLIALGYGFADVAALISTCWLLAITVGAAMANPAILPALILIVALFLLMNVTLERLLGSWLELLLARRFTRELIFGLFILLSVSAQFVVRPLVERYEHGQLPLIARLLPYLSSLPPSLAGRAIAAADHGLSSVVWSAAGGLLLYSFLFGALLWRRFAAQYRGEELSEAAAPSRSAVRTIPTQQAQPDALGLLSPPLAAILRKEFRYLRRNSFVLMSLLMTPLLVLLFSSQIGGKHSPLMHRGVSLDLFFPGTVGYLILILMMPAYNSFAYEGRGIQTYFTAPVRFRDVFLAKNLVQTCVLALELTVTTAVLLWRLGTPSPPVLAATLAGVIFVAAAQLAVANWTSLSFPLKLEFGSLRGQRSSGVAIWIGFGMQILLGAVCSLVLFSARWTGNPWLPVKAFVGLAAATLAGYFASLDSLTQLAEKKKEVLIEALCH
jgi:ABC-2 type transport system permease protein